VTPIALIIFLGFGTLGTLTGGWLADRFGRVRTIRVAYLFAIPSPVGLTFAGSPWIFPLIALTVLLILPALALFRAFRLNEPGQTTKITEGTKCNQLNFFSRAKGALMNYFLPKY
jgi:FSR family fosmidomycin resistance protein-like MFS transporter